MQDENWERDHGSVVKRSWSATDNRGRLSQDERGYQWQAHIYLLGKGSTAGRVVKEGKPWLLETYTTQRHVDREEGLRVVETREADRTYHLASYEEAITVGNSSLEAAKEEAIQLGLFKEKKDQ